MQWHEKRKSASELVANAIEQILPGASAIPASAWHEVKQTVCFDGVKLYQQGFSNVLNRVMSNEAYEYIRYAGGFDTILSNWNATDAIPWYLAYFGPDAQYMRLVDGFESVALQGATSAPEPLQASVFARSIRQKIGLIDKIISRVKKYPVVIKKKGLANTALPDVMRYSSSN